MNAPRAERRLLQRTMAKQARAWPHHLVEVPRDEWPPRRDGRAYPIALFRSRRFLVQVFEEAPLDGRDVRRLSVNRVTIGADGHWEQDIPWLELQRCKRETGYGDWYGVEIFPRDRDLVNVANMRHLWLLSAPLPLGWFEPEGKSEP